MKTLQEVIEKWKEEIVKLHKLYSKTHELSNQSFINGQLGTISDILTDLKNINGLSVERNVLSGFIKELKEEFADVNLDYLDFAAERYLNRLKP